MANTKITSHVIANDAVTVDMITDAAVTADKLHATLDLSGKTLTLPATAIPSASTATTQSAADNSTKIATTAYVETAIANLNDSAPAALNTLNEIAAALGDDANYASTTTAAIAAKLPLAGGTMTGAIAMGTAKITGLGDPTANQDAGTKTYIDTADALKLNLSGGTLTGDLILNTTTALKIPAGTTAQRPSAATGQLRWNTSDGALEVYNGSAWTAVGTGSSNKILDTFTGDGSTTAYTLSVTPANEDALIVFIDGVYQEKGDYALSNAVLTLDTAPASGEKLAVHITTASVHDGTSGLNQQFTGDGSTVAFTLSQDPKSENNTQIYINGVYQQKTDYTVSGTTLTFDTAPETGDIIEVNMFTVTTLGNTDTVSEGTSNLYHTDARARGAISVSGNALSYNSSTGVITSAYEETPTFTGTVTAPTVDAAILDGENFKINGAQGSDGQVLTSTGSGVAWEAVPASGATSLNGLSDVTKTGSNPAINTNPSTGVGTLWINSSSGQSYVCTDATSNDNVWTNITEGASIQSTIDVDYLVIAGGGAGGRGNSAAGGGGAGGYRNSYNSEASGGGASSETFLQLTAGTVYTITVGAGGAQNTAGANHVGNSGAASSIVGSDITDVTTVGGGGGAASTGNATGGGSGGGGAWTAKTGGAGTANQGFKGGDAFAASNQWSGAGGGGAGAAGANVTVGSNDSPTDGGVGLASSITGSSVYRAGGGGGCADAGTGSSGGNGGGGNGGGSGNPVQAGTANTGGGGGAGPSTTPGAGGSGVVILRMFTSVYSGTTTGSPTVSQDGNKTILTYTSSGTYTG